MNANHSGTAPGGDARESILEMLQDTMSELQQAIEDMDLATVEEQQLQLRRYHEPGYLADQYRKLQRDTDLDKMEQRLELLEDDPIGEAY